MDARTLSKKDLIGALAQTQAHAEAVALKYARLKAEADSIVAILVQRLGGNVTLTSQEFVDIRELKLGKRQIPDDQGGGVELRVMSAEEVARILDEARAKKEAEPKKSDIIVP